MAGMPRNIRGTFSLLLLCSLAALGSGCGRPSQPASTVFAPPSRDYFVVKADTLNMRRCPDITCPVTALLFLGETVAVRRSTGDWSEIERKQGGIGWVASRYLGAQHVGNRLDPAVGGPALPEEELASPQAIQPPEISDELADPGASPSPVGGPPAISEEFGQ